MLRAILYLRNVATTKVIPKWQTIDSYSFAASSTVQSFRTKAATSGVLWRSIAARCARPQVRLSACHNYLVHLTVGHLVV